MRVVAAWRDHRVSFASLTMIGPLSVRKNTSTVFNIEDLSYD